MPDFATHYLVGSQVALGLPPAGRALVGRYPAAFHWGLEGPDPLFYHQILLGGGPLAPMGGQMHREQTDSLLQALTRAILEAPSDRRELLTAYGLGFLCHYATDHRVHPYVYWVCEQQRALLPPSHWKGLHGRVECRLDDILCPLLGGFAATSLPLRRLFPLEPAFLAAIGPLYQGLLENVYGQNAPAHQVADAFRTCLAITALFIGPARHGVWLAARGAETVAGLPGALSCHTKGKPWPGEPRDLLNMEGRIWRNLSQPQLPLEASVPQLLAGAADDSLAFCGYFLSMLADEAVRPFGITESFDWGNPRPKENTGKK